MRGKVRTVKLIAYSTRITPAYAGKSACDMREIVSRRDHPRLCGEKLLVYYRLPFRGGSPPPMRGKALVPVQTSPILRITPAYAGKSSSLPQNGQGFRDHPRLCGEKEKRTQINTNTKGSPPPMRGKGCSTSCVQYFTGITPAYAGKRKSPVRGDSRCQDHPRLCGEKQLRVVVVLIVVGSPPPMRGKALGAEISRSV